jgi:ATP-dependent protease ClpP protease subunit
MKTIVISGEIGWEVWPEDIRRQFDAAGGEDVELQISSPGGYVYDGIEIFNIVKNYVGKVTAKLVGLAASMASYIPMAADKVIAESNAVFMIHNASTVTAGDHRDLRHDADVLEGFTNLLSKKYIEKTGKSAADIRALMDAESWFFGSEIKDAGFADEIVNSEKDEDKASAILTAKATFKTFTANLKKQEGREGEIEKIAALPPKSDSSKKEPSQISKSQRPSPSANQKSTKKVKMDLNKLKNEYPEIYAQAFEEGRVAESKRVSGHATMAKKTGAYDFAMECIKDSAKSVQDDDVFAEYQTAGMKKKDLENSADDAPDGVQTESEDEGKTDAEKAKEMTDKIMAKHKKPEDK